MALGATDSQNVVGFLNLGHRANHFSDCLYLVSHLKKAKQKNSIPWTLGFNIKDNSNNLFICNKTSDVVSYLPPFL